MFFILSKIIGYMLNPTGWIFMALLGALVLRKKWRRISVIVAFVLFYFFTNNTILKVFMERWEQNGITEVTEKYDVAIILGGWIAEDNESVGRVVIKHVPDRLLQGYRLYQQGKVDKLLISGGSGHYLYPWKREAASVKKYLLSVGMPEEDILVDTLSKNTYENAVYSKQILDQHDSLQRKLLITSALHIRRSKRCFEKVGLEVDVMGTDQVCHRDKMHNFETLFVPDMNTYRNWHLLMHEWIGYLVYDMRGYI